MASSPPWKVYSKDGEYVGSLKHPWHAAMLISGMGGGTIRYGHQHICWAEGFEKIPAAESYYVVTETCQDRLNRKAFVTASTVRH